MGHRPNVYNKSRNGGVTVDLRVFHLPNVASVEQALEDLRGAYRDSVVVLLERVDTYEKDPIHHDPLYHG